MSEVKTDAGSQTLSRGLTALELIGQASGPLSVSELSEKLGIHRSMTYRLVKTLEQHGFISKTDSGSLVLGIRLASLARGVSKNLQEAAAPELEALAESLGMTAFLATYDGEQVVTLSSAEPRNAPTTVAKKPGTRHPIERGAPGHVIRSLLDPAHFPVQQFEFSQDEVIPGIAAVSVPLVVRGEQPSALSVLYLPQEVDREQIAQKLSVAAARIVLAVGG